MIMDKFVKIAEINSETSGSAKLIIEILENQGLIVVCDELAGLCGTMYVLKKIDEDTNNDRCK